MFLTTLLLNPIGVICYLVPVLKILIIYNACYRESRGYIFRSSLSCWFHILIAVLIEVALAYMIYFTSASKLGESPNPYLVASCAVLSCIIAITYSSGMIGQLLGDLMSGTFPTASKVFKDRITVLKFSETAIDKIKHRITYLKELELRDAIRGTGSWRLSHCLTELPVLGFRERVLIQHELLKKSAPKAQAKDFLIKDTETEQLFFNMLSCLGKHEAKRRIILFQQDYENFNGWRGNPRRILIQKRVELDAVESYSEYTQY